MKASIIEKCLQLHFPTQVYAALIFPPSKIFAGTSSIFSGSIQCLGSRRLTQ
jgi:hypothetical protein